MSTELKILVVVVVLLVLLTLGVAITLAVRLVRARRTLRRAGVPVENRWVFWGAMVYLVLPADLLPDPVFLDDIGFLLLALRSLRSAGAKAPYAAHLTRRATGRDRPVERLTHD